MRERIGGQLDRVPWQCWQVASSAIGNDLNKAKETESKATGTKPPHRERQQADRGTPNP